MATATRRNNGRAWKATAEPLKGAAFQLERLTKYLTHQVSRNALKSLFPARYVIAVFRVTL
ncbi:hypothetical protein SAMN05443635_10539 [Roseobacter denitrificans OCh 114]|nr:hypothetical protein SAMN05443635_10539 [Roseobacter denitrificans OCh 114]